MKVLMADKFFFIKGGAERYYFDLKTLLESKGHEVIPFSMKHPRNAASPYSRYFVDQIDFNPERLKDRVTTGVRSAARIVYSLQARRNIERLIRDTRPEIAHLHMIDHQLSPSILPAFRKAGIPVVQTVHTYKAVCPSYRLFIMHKKRICEKCMRGAFYHAIIERCHKRSLPASALLAVEASVHAAFRFYKRDIDLFLVPSVFMGKKMAEGGYDPSKIRHLPYTIGMDDYPVRTGSDGYFIFYGRLSEEKGIETLIRAVNAGDPRRLKIIGDGPMRSQLQALVRSRGLQNVEFTGSLGGKALQKQVLGAEFVVVPSEWYENSPLVIYEAFTMGKPVVGARIGGIPELIEHGKDGFLFEAGNSGDLRKTIRIFFDHPGLASRMGRAARVKAEKTFKPEIHYDRLMRLYEDAFISRRRNEVE
jgi:glycosyltransferase involved in cell wall biosynthesis